MPWSQITRNFTILRKLRFIACISIYPSSYTQFKILTVRETTIWNIAWPHGREREIAIRIICWLFKFPPEVTHTPGESKSRGHTWPQWAGNSMTPCAEETHNCLINSTTTTTRIMTYWALCIFHYSYFHRHRTYLPYLAFWNVRQRY